MASFTLSVVIITFNEEKNIARCLESVLEVADEIIVVDAYSTDNTEKICRKYDVEFYKKEWQGYSAAKNFGTSQAQNDYILSLDADEALSGELKTSISDIKINSTFQAYYLKRLANYCGKWIKHCGWYPDYKLRLWNRKLGEWHGTVHEILKFEQQIPIGKLSGDLLHYSFSSIKDHINKANMFSEISAKEAIKKGRKINFVYHLFLNPAYTFINKYIFKLGFLDGYYGFLICVISAFSHFLKYSKIRAYNKVANQ
jgi:glycosyltransferase involved in cell wall biosynthesis